MKKKPRCAKCSKVIKINVGTCTVCQKQFCIYHLNRFAHGCEEKRNKIQSVEIHKKIDKI